MRDYDKIANFHALEQAYYRARRGKRHKDEVIEFEMHLSQNLMTMLRLLEERTYAPLGYYHFVITRPKRRDVYAAYFPDRVVLHAICFEVLAHRLGRHLIHDNAACQVGKGTHFALKRLRRHLHEHYREHGTRGYFYQFDMSKFFESIPHDRLKAMLTARLPDADVCELLFRFIDNYPPRDTRGLPLLGRPGMGCPLGNQTSQWFGITYLDALDKFIVNELGVTRYSRYMDDGVLVCRDYAHARACEAAIGSFVADVLGMTLNPKSHVTPVTQGIAYLGWRLWLQDNGHIGQRLKTSVKKDMTATLRHLYWQCQIGAASWEEFECVFTSYRAHLSYGETHTLIEQLSAKFPLPPGCEDDLYEGDSCGDNPLPLLDIDFDWIVAG